MLFNSYEFIFVFLPITLAGYFLFAKYKLIKLSAVWLVFASLTFYAYWDIRYLPLLLVSILFNFTAGSLIEKNNQNKIKSKQILTAAILVNLCLLGYYKIKYFLYLPSYETLKRHLSKPVPPDEIIESDPSRHINDIKFKSPTLYFNEYRINDTLNELKEIQTIAEKNNINLIFFINPIHQTSYLANDLEKFAEFKQKLASITSYYDFSGLNSITTNNYYYYETSHYRPIVGDMIIARIFGIKGIAPDDFGVFVPQTVSDFAK